MKVDIGPFSSDIIPVSRWISRYETWRNPTIGYLAEKEYTKVDRFVIGLLDKVGDIVQPLNRWSNRRKRRVKVRVDYYDVWSADNTLGTIIHPILVKLKEVKQGVGYVDNEDVPEELRSTPTDQEKYGWDGSTDDKYEARWEWVLDEMIWAFGQHGLEDDSDQFYHNTDQLDMLFEKVPGTELNTISFNHQKDPNKPPYFRDNEGIEKHAERKANGRRLFAKYYESLWD
jgi:hypothetical protein